MYIGYHDGGPDSGPIHSPSTVCREEGWHVVAEQTRPLDIAGQRFDVVQSVYAKGGDQEFFIYWYQVKGRC